MDSVDVDNGDIILDSIRKILHDIIGCDDIGYNKNYYNLMDHLDVLEFVMALENDHNIILECDDIKKMNTLHKLNNYINRVNKNGK